MSARPLLSIRVFIVDDHPVVRLGLSRMLDQAGGFDNVGQAGDARSAIRGIEHTQPDVVLSDLVMPGLDGIGLVRALSDMRCPARVILLTERCQMADVRRAFEAGASGFLDKVVSSGELAVAIQAVHRGQRALSAGAARALDGASRTDRPGADLTPREREILRLLACGHDNHEIASRTAIALSTVKYHVSNILDKLQVHNRTAAALVALEHQLVLNT